MRVSRRASIRLPVRGGKGQRMFLDTGGEQMELDKELIDKLLAAYKGSEDLIGEQGLLKQLTKALAERAMQAELTHHLGSLVFH